MDINEMNRAASELEESARNARDKGLTAFAAEYEAEAKVLRGLVREAVQALGRRGHDTSEH